MAKECDARVADALYGFVGWLTSRPYQIVFGQNSSAINSVNALRDWAQEVGVNLDIAEEDESDDGIE